MSLFEVFGSLSAIEMLGLLIVAHAFADYPLQGKFMATAKNHKTSIPGIPWYQLMAAHCTIHAGFVGVITGSIWLGLAEFVIHFASDYAKCEGRISYNIDQAIHILCKVTWVLIVVYGFV